MGYRNTAAFSADISAALNARGIKHEVRSTQYGDDVITIDRTSMVRQYDGLYPQGGNLEQLAYDATLAHLREICGEAAHVMWSVRTDDYLGVEVYAKDPS